MKHTIESAARAYATAKKAATDAKREYHKAIVAVRRSHEIVDGPCLCIPEAPWQDCTPKPSAVCWKEMVDTVEEFGGHPVKKPLPREEWCEECIESTRLRALMMTARAKVRAALRTLEAAIERTHS